MKHLRRFRISTSVFSFLSLAALVTCCDEGVKVTVCRVHAKQSVLLCVDPANRESRKTYAEAEGYICKPSEDEATFLKLCQLKEEKCGSGFTPTVCSLNSATSELLCLDPSKRTFSIPLSDSESFVCKSQGDERVMLEYCQQRCRV